MVVVVVGVMIKSTNPDIPKKILCSLNVDYMSGSILNAFMY
jgi:hypothetical protein